MRYPGGKKKLLSAIAKHIPDDFSEYREPFFGGGSVGLYVLKEGVEHSWINDLDFGIYSLWKSVKNQPDELIRRVLSYTPSAKDFYTIQEEFLSKKHMSSLEAGFKKLVIHQISFSGLGVRAGSPIGGRNQTGKWLVGCRWNPKNIEREIRKASKLLANTRITNMDFEDVVTESSVHSVFMFIDPPYYNKGNDLYLCGFDQHEKLSKLLARSKFNWVLTYDDCPEIRKLFRFARIHSVDVNYTIKTSRPRKELIICP